MSGIGKSNLSSYDNPLAYPIPVNKPSSRSQNNINASITQQAQPNPGGITKSNFSSADNPLANFGYESGSPAAKRLPLDAYKKKPDYYGSYDASPPQQDYYDSAQYYQPQAPPPVQQQQQQQPSYPLEQPQPVASLKYQPLPPIQAQQQPYQPSAYNNPPFSPSRPQQSPNQQPAYGGPEYNNEPSTDYMMQEKTRIRNEVDSLSQYPFGRRFNNDTSSFTNNDYNQVTYPPEASMYNSNPPYAKFIDEPALRLNKDNIVERTNDLPPYDPIKHRSGNPQGYDFDPVSLQKQISILE
jgi:hypothetical protein